VISLKIYINMILNSLVIRSQKDSKDMIIHLLMEELVLIVREICLVLDVVKIFTYGI